MKLDYFGKTDKGKVRKGNEDFFATEKINDNEFLFVVADGMGGHQAGHVASQLGTESFIQHYVELRKKKSVADSLKGAVEQANEAILTKATNETDKRGMGTTFSAISISGSSGCFVHVGDSRIYLIRNNKISQLTTDHTFVEKLVEEGKLTEEEARDHPQKNILYMSLGARQAFSPTVSDAFALREGDIFVLCSDGLNNMVTDQDIKEQVTGNPPKKAVEELIKMANYNGGTDNITLQVIHVEEKKANEKTEPIKIVKHRGKLASFFAKFKREEK